MPHLGIGYDRLPTNYGSLSQEVLDSVISLFQAGIIFYLSVPLALTLSMILLQSTPSEIDEPLHQVMVEVRQVCYSSELSRFVRCPT